MTLEEAIKNVKEIARVFVGNLEQHRAVQESIILIESCLENAAKKEGKENERP